MRSGERLALAIVIVLVLLVGGTTCAAAYAWHRAGTMRIAVHDARPDGNDFSIALPGLLVDAVIALCPIPQDATVQARLRDIQPALEAVALQLSRVPDAVLVDIKNDEQTLRIEKAGPELRIHVVSADERLDLTIPLESVRRLAEKLEA